MAGRNLTILLAVVPCLVVVGLTVAVAPKPASDKPATAEIEAKTTTDAIVIKADPAKRLPGVNAALELVRIPAGKITLKGPDGKDRTHQIKSIWMGKCEVTWDLYDPYWRLDDLTADDRDRVRREGHDARSRPSVPYEPPDRGWGVNGFPAGSVHPLEVKRYVQWLSRMTGKKYRLPTEAEWEYACRAGADAPLKLEEKELAEVAWFEKNSDAEPHKVGLKKPNAWGLHDMLGNMAEWVVREDGQLVSAGGSFYDAAGAVHSGARETPDFKALQRRDCQEPKSKHWLTDGMMLGIRVVRED